MEEKIKSAIAHFDKKVTDYQIHVDRELIKQDEDIKKHENYLINTMDSHKKMITDFIEENQNSGGNTGGSGGSDDKPFEIVHNIVIPDGDFAFNLPDNFKEAIIVLNTNWQDKQIGIQFFGMSETLQNHSAYWIKKIGNVATMTYYDIGSGDVSHIMNRAEGLPFFNCNSSDFFDIPIETRNASGCGLKVYAR